jgi:hypothetical protein
MMKHLKYFLMALFIFTGFISNVYAIDGDIYNDGYWRESSSGVWQPVTNTTGGIKYVNDQETDATRTLTADESGITIIASHASYLTQTAFTFVLPDPSSTDDLEYSLITGGVATASFDPYMFESIFYKTCDGGDKITSPAATGSSVTVVSHGGNWFIKNMVGNFTDGD